MAQNITLLGASYSDVPSVLLPKTGGGQASFTDVTDTTAAAADVAQGKYFYTSAGVRTEGTSTGGGGTEAGTVTQDANGFLVLDDDPPAGPTLITKSITQNGTYNASSDSADGYSSVTVNVSGGSGLVYETGTWTPTEDVANYTIALNGTHSVAPWFYMIADASNTYSDATTTNYCVMYKNWEQSLGAYFYPSSTALYYGEARTFYRASNTSSITNGSSMISHSYTDPSSVSNSYPRYWATESSIRAYTNSTTRYWRAGRTYKWIAVWTPTS